MQAQSVASLSHSLRLEVACSYTIDASKPMLYRHTDMHARYECDYYKPVLCALSTSVRSLVSDIGYVILTYINSSSYRPPDI